MSFRQIKELSRGLSKRIQHSVMRPFKVRLFGDSAKQANDGENGPQVDQHDRIDATGGLRSSSSPLTVTLSHCRSWVICFEQLWTIEGVSDYFDDSFVGPPILYSLDFSPSSSPSLPAINARDNEPPIKMYLNMKTRSVQNRDYVSLFLNWNAQGLGGEPSGFCVVFKMSLLDEYGVKQFSRASIKHFGPNDRSWGWNNFILAATLLHPDSGLLKDDTLNILCEVKILECNQTNQTCAGRGPKGTSLSTPPGDAPTVQDANSFAQWKRNLYQNGQKLTDVTFQVDGTEFHAHKLVLTSGSPVFEAMFSHDMTEKLQSKVKIEEMQPTVFERILQYIYTGTVDEMDMMIVDELLIAADKFQMDSLKELCEDWLISRMSEQNVSDLYQLATIYNAFKLKDAVVDYAQINAQQSLQTLLNTPEMALKANKLLAGLLDQK